MSVLDILIRHKDLFDNYEDCYRLAEIMEINEKRRKRLFNSWYSNWFIFFPIFLYKSYLFDKRSEILDKEFYAINKKLTAR